VPMAWLAPIRKSPTPAPAVVLLHPAGFGAGVYAPLVKRLGADLRVLVPERCGYGSEADRAVPASLADSVDLLARILDDAGLERAVIVGVSAGATLTLEFARRHPDRVASALAHEPLLGPIAPELHARVSERIRRLQATPGSDTQAVADFMCGLVGPATWARLEPDWRRAITRHAQVTRREIAQFEHFALDHESLSALAECGVHTSVGARSDPARQAVAEVMRQRGIPVHVLPAAGHLAFFDNLAEFAALVVALAGSPARS